MSAGSSSCGVTESVSRPAGGSGSTVREKLRRLRADVTFLWWPSDPFLERQLNYFHYFALLGAVAYPLTGSFLWGWDFALDPMGAQSTLWLRAGYLTFLPIAVVHAVRASYGVRLWMTSLSLLAGELIYLAVTARLADGYAAGIGGFMYFSPIGAMLLFSYSLRAMTVYAAAALIVPLVPVALGLVPGYPFALHLTIQVPAFCDALLVGVTLGWLNLRRYRVELALERASNTDLLTGLANRRQFNPVLEAEVARARRHGRALALALIDIDHFKRINDQRGHAAGDEALCALAEVFRSEIRDSDLAARLGGDEFAILAPETTEEAALAMAERIRAAIAERCLNTPDGEAFGLTVSCGVAAMRGEHAGGAGLFADADSALYEAKRRGRNAVACHGV